MTSIAFAAEDAYLHGEAAHELAEGIHAAEHVEKGGLPQFEPDWFASQIFWLAISFTVLYIIFSKKTLPDISGVIENRKNHIQSDLETAEKLTAEADEVHDLYQAGLAKAQDSAAKSILSVEEKMKAKATEAQDNFRSKSEEELNAAEGRIQAAKMAAMDDMNAIAAEAAADAVKKIIGRKTSANEVKPIVEAISGDTRGKVKAA